MVIYWGMLIWVFVIGYMQPDEHNPLKSNEAKAYRAKWGSALLLMAPIIFFALFRSDCVDTASYIAAYNRTPTDMRAFSEWVDSQKGSQLFHGLQMLFKCFISEEPTMWFGLIAVVQGLIVTRFFQKYSPNIGLSVYIFMGSTLFTWMYNGIRQFIAVTVLLACTEWIIKNRWYLYLPVVLLLGGLNPIFDILGWGTPPWFLCGIHQSALLMLPVFFFVQGKAFSWKIWVMATIFAVLAVTGGLEALLGSATESTEYADDMQYVTADSGANPLRAVLPFVPVLMAFYKRKEIAEMSEEDRPLMIDLCINMAVITFTLYVASSLTSGMYVGRLPIYTELYNLVLIPWLILHPYKKNAKLLTQAVLIIYLGWFIYQMHITWNGLTYGSDVLGIHLWGGS